MSTNFTPLPKAIAHGKGAVNVNTVLIIIALVITILLGTLMWFLVAQKQQEEDKAKVPTNVTPQRTVEAVIEKSDVSGQPSVTSAAIPTASSTGSPQAVQVTITPVASPSATITP